MYISVKIRWKSVLHLQKTDFLKNSICYNDVRFSSRQAQKRVVYRYSYNVVEGVFAMHKEKQLKIFPLEQIHQCIRLYRLLITDYYLKALLLNCFKKISDG